MNTKIITIASVVFALIFVVLLAVMMGTITNKGNSANTKLVDTLEISSGTDLSGYDNVTIKGSTVISAITNGKTLNGDTKMWIMVETGEQTSVYGYGTKTGDASDLLDDLQYSDATEFTKSVYASTQYTYYSNSDSSSSDYINEAAYFDSNIISNKNGIIVGIYCKQN